MTKTLEATAGPPLTVSVIRQGAWYKPDIKRVALGEDDAVLKDFSDKPWPVKLLGRWQVERELRALRRLAGIAGVPRCHGAVGRLGILMERIDGERITRWCRRQTGAPGATRDADAALDTGGAARVAAMFERLAGMVTAIHDRGVAHIDLRKRDNILVTTAGRPCVIDFNASFCFEPGGLRARLLFPLMRRIDDAAVLKWKSRLAPHLLSVEDGRRHRLMTFLRRFWIFN